MEPTTESLLAIIKAGAQPQPEESEIMEKLRVMSYGDAKMLDPNTIYSLIFCRCGILNKLRMIVDTMKTLNLSKDDEIYIQLFQSMIDILSSIHSLAKITDQGESRFRDTPFSKTIHRRYSRWIRSIHVVCEAIQTIRDEDKSKNIQTYTQVKTDYTEGETPNEIIVKNETQILFDLNLGGGMEAQTFVLKTTTGPIMTMTMDNDVKDSSKGLLSTQDDDEEDEDEEEDELEEGKSLLHYDEQEEEATIENKQEEEEKEEEKPQEKEQVTTIIDSASGEVITV